jgi:hypothetical protein
VSPRGWSIAGLVAGAAAAVVDAAVLAWSGQDLGDVVWPVVVAPLVLVPIPVVVPTRAVRVAAATTMTVWCVLTTLSLGPVFLPALLLMWIAAAADARRQRERTA